MNIQNRNSVERVGSKSQFQLYWKAHPQLPGIYCHRLSTKQIQAHSLTIARDQLELEISFIEGRINNKHPFICCVYLYEEDSPPSQSQHADGHLKLKVYTDRTIPFEKKDWNQLNIINGLIGLKRLLMTYGPIKIVSGLFCKNEIGEVKMWVSEKPQRNKPDLPLFNESEMVSSLIDLFSTKNPFFSYIFVGCNTIRECIDKLQKLSTSSKKHRYKPSTGIHLPQNLFRPGSGYPQGAKDSIKIGQMHFQKQWPRDKSNSEYQTFGSLWNSNQNWFHKQNKMKPTKGKNFPHRSTSFFSNTTGKFFNRKESNRNSGPSINFHSQSDSFKYCPTTPPSRFGTGQFNHKPTYSHRGGQCTWREPLPNKSYDITIINNNVSNYISHFPKGSVPQSTDRGHLREAKTPEFSWTGKHTSQSPSSKQVSRRKGIPSFIKNKGIQSQQLSYQSSNQGTRILINPSKQSEKKLSKESEVEPYHRKQAKIFTFFGQERDSQTQNGPSFYTIKSKEAIIHEKKEQKSKNEGRIVRTQSHFFPSNKNRKLSKEDPQSPSKNKQSESPSDKTPETSENIKQEQRQKISSSIELKRMLKKEYQDLLGLSIDPIAEQSQSMKYESHRDSEEKKKSIIKQSELKDKIKQKQEAFAELKMEALKVLTDF